MSSVKYWTYLLLGIILLIGIGCSKNVQVKGKVIFTDDGAPLEAGTIFFESGSMMARGTIQEDGTFTMGSEKQTDGLPPGTYNVYISNAIKLEGDQWPPRMVPLLDSKYNDAATSGITVTVDKSTRRTPLEIKVDRFK